MPFNSKVHFNPENATKGINIISPASGQVIPLTDEKDGFVISQLGQGIAIKLSAQQIISPIKGKVIEWQPTLGKVIIQTQNKLRFLMQLPFSFNQHHGLGIKPHFVEGQNILKGSALLTLDLYQLQQIDKDICLFFILIDDKPFQSINIPHKYVNAGEDIIFSLIPKSVKTTKK